MKNIKCLLLVIVSLLLILVNGQFAFGAFSHATLEAYKLDLENHIDAKIRQAVKPMVEEDSFSLSVTVNLKNTDELKKLLPADFNQDNTADEEELEDPTFNFVDNKPEEQETVLPLTKLGLWQRKKESNRNGKKLGDGSGMDSNKPSFVSYRDLVDSININMFVDKSVTDDSAAAVERILRGTVSNADGPLNIQFKKMPLMKTVKAEAAAKEKALEEEKKAKEEGANRDPASVAEGAEQGKTPLDYLSEFKMPLAILIFTFTIFVLGLIITFNINRISIRKMNLVEKQAEREEAAFKAAQFREEENHLKAQNAIAPMNDDELEKKRSAVKMRLTNLIQSRPKDLALMIRRWVLFRGEGTEEGLNFCARHYSVAEINTILENLSDEEQRSWNLALSRPYGPLEERKAMAFLETQVLVHMISSIPRNADDLKQMVSQLSLQDTMLVISKDQELGAIVLNFLQSAQVAKIFEALDRDTVARISQLAVQITPEVIRGRGAELQSFIEQIKKQSNVKSPFVDRLQSLVSEVTPDKEPSLFVALATQMDKRALLDLAKTHLPAELIPQVPLELLKKAFSTISLVRRAEMILSQPNERRNFLMSIVGEGKSREMIDDEIDNINLDRGKASLLQRNGDGFWKQFIVLVRGATREECQRGDLDDIIKPWVESLAQKGRGGGRRSA